MKANVPCSVVALLKIQVHEGKWSSVLFVNVGKRFSLSQEADGSGKLIPRAVGTPALRSASCLSLSASRSASPLTLWRERGLLKNYHSRLKSSISSGCFPPELAPPPLVCGNCTKHRVSFWLCHTHGTHVDLPHFHDPLSIPLPLTSSFTISFYLLLCRFYIMTNKEHTTHKHPLEKAFMLKGKKKSLKLDPKECSQHLRVLLR